MSKEIVNDILITHGMGKVMLVTDDSFVNYRGKDGKVVRGITIKSGDLNEADSVRRKIVDELNRCSFKSLSDSDILVSDWRNHNTVLSINIEQLPKYCISTGRLPIETQTVVTLQFMDVPK